MATQNRKPYLTSNLLNQTFLDECQDNLTNQLELIIDVETPSGTIYLSDRNKYVGERFYESRLNFPVISRTIGEFLNPSIEFSQLQIEINNVDGFLNHDLPSGADYTPWIGKAISVKLGLRDVASTYTEIFRGKVTEEGGFQRTTNTVILIYRNDFSYYDKQFPKTTISADDYPDIESENENAILPLIYGDYTVNVQTGGASIPAICLNGADPNVNGETGNTVNIKFLISDHDLTYFDTSEVYILRGDVFNKVDSADIVNVSGNKYFEMRQKSTTPSCNTKIGDEFYGYKTGEKFFVKVKGKDLGAYDDNIIEISKDILLNHAGVPLGMIDATWDHYRDKTTPAESAVKNIKARAWIRDPIQTFTFVLSLLEQVRIEAFINRSGKIALSSLHFDEFTTGTYTIRAWDVEKDSFSPRIDDKMNFNRARADFNFLPNINENNNETATYKNQAAITQIGKEISKKVVYPNLYEQNSVELQLIETLKITSSFLEIVSMNLTWRSLLRDIGEFIKLDVNIGGVRFDNVPCMIRDIGYDPLGIKIICSVWSFQMIPFTGWNPAYNGIVGGQNATIEKE